MMRTTRNAVAVGLVSLLVAVGLYLAVSYVSETRKSAGQYKVWAVFPDASGLVAKSRVRMAGIPVGYIDSIELYVIEPDSSLGEGPMEAKIGARVDIVVDEKVALHDDAVALRSAGSILGDQFIVLLPGSGVRPVLKDGDRINNVGQAGLLGNLDKISTDIGDVTRNLKAVFGSEQGGQQMGEVLANMRDISKSVNELLKANSEAINRTLSSFDKMASSSGPGVEQIVSDIREITNQVKKFVDQNAGTAGEAVTEAGDTVKEIRSAVEKLDHTLENLEGITDDLAEGKGTVGRLLDDDQLIDDVERITEQAGEFVDRLYRFRTIVGLSGEYNFYDNTLKTTLQLRLQPREDKFYLIEAVIDPRGATERTEVVIESTHPDDPAQYREVRHKTSDTLLFSFMFARRIYFSTWRFGIKESSGGVGLDLHFLKDRIETSIDIYRFGEDVFPRLKAMLAMEFLKGLFITGGVNDVLNSKRDFFVGLMLRFDDEDLAAMMTLAPSI